MNPYHGPNDSSGKNADYHIIVAGSLLGVAVNRAKFSFPVGKVDMKTLYPMDMEEFLRQICRFPLLFTMRRCSSIGSILF